MTDPGKLSQGGRLRFLLKDTAIYGVAGALNKALALVTFPILARHFSVSDYGVIDLLNTAVVLLVTLLVFGQDSAVARYFYEDTDPEARRQTVSQSFFFQLGVLALVLPVLWIAAHPIAAMLKLDEDGAWLVRLMILQAPFFLFVNFSQGLLKWTFKRNQFLLVSLGSAIATMVGLIVGTWFFDISITGAFMVYLGVRAGFGLLGLWFIREWLAVPAGLQRLVTLLPFAGPFGVVAVLSSLHPVLERSMVQSMIGPVELGLFAVGAKVAALISLPVNAFETTWGPFSLSIHKQEDAIATYRTVLKAYCLALFVIVLGMAGFGELVVTLLGSSRYAGASVVIFPLAMGMAVQAAGSVLAVGIVISKRAHNILYGYLVLVGVSFGATLVLAPHFGIVGVAWASFLALSAKALVEAALAQRAWPMDWQAGKIAILTGLAVAAGLVHQLTLDTLAFAGISVVPLVAIVVIVALAWFVLLSESERAWLVAKSPFKSRLA